MIRIDKPLLPPARLRDGRARTVEDQTAYDANTSDYEDGTRTFEFARNIYGHRTVKEALCDAQYAKCCYCEGRFGPSPAFAAADVEHYRPKGATKQDEDSERLFPGYYWLAYSWANLYLSCQTCNRSHKKDLFPLADPARRARSHRNNVADENPLLLDPGNTEGVERHIIFRRERAVGLTDEGRRTICVIGLNRPGLIEERLERWRVLQGLLRVIQLCTGIEDTAGAASLMRDARRDLAAAVLPAAKFSAMAIHLLRGTEFVGGEATEEV